MSSHNSSVHRIRLSREALHVYLEATDIAEELQRKGVQFVRYIHETAWRTRGCVIRDTDGHTLYFGQPSAEPFMTAISRTAPAASRYSATARS